VSDTLVHCVAACHSTTGATDLSMSLHQAHSDTECLDAGAQGIGLEWGQVDHPPEGPTRAKGIGLGGRG
jgi:hypothetical protein